MQLLKMGCFPKVKLLYYVYYELRITNVRNENKPSNNFPNDNKIIYSQRCHDRLISSFINL